MALTEYKPGTTFPGVIGRTPDVSKPAWPAPNRAKEGSPHCCCRLRANASKALTANGGEKYSP
jgi:hypothetical protein